MLFLIDIKYKFNIDILVFWFKTDEAFCFEIDIAFWFKTDKSFCFETDLAFWFKTDKAFWLKQSKFFTAITHSLSYKSSGTSVH